MADLLPVADYVERILATVSPLQAFPKPLMEALGLALAEDVAAGYSNDDDYRLSAEGYRDHLVEVKYRPSVEQFADRIPAAVDQRVTRRNPAGSPLMTSQMRIGTPP